MNGSDSTTRTGQSGALSLLRDYLPLLALVVSGLAWGLKLEQQFAVMQERQVVAHVRISATETAISAGILPRAQEQISNIKAQQAEQQRRIERLEHQLP